MTANEAQDTVTNGFLGNKHVCIDFELTLSYLFFQDSTENDQIDDEWVDIVGNRDVLKRTLRAGKEKRPSSGEFVKIVSKNLASQKCEEIEFILGYGFSIDGIIITNTSIHFF
jgi:hypothetical protein